jgi:hypothetical protein
MAEMSSLDHEEILRRISADLADGYDEELEMEIEDHHPLPGVDPSADQASREYRHQYFQRLFTLQAELVKLQDWVVAAREKVVILFEGRDAAGKGGAIKRISQRLNPRVCRVVALPARNGTSSAMSPIYPRPGKSCFSIAAGTTAPGSSTSWVSARRRSTRSSSARSPNSSACWCAPGCTC